MAGTINLALSQQFDMDGEPLSGGLLSFFVAGTTNPANSFQDLGLTIVNPNPLVLDASGRVPMFYLADGFIKIRLADKNGVTVIAADQLLVIGPSSGGGGGGAGVDVTTVLATGDIKTRYGTGTLDGFVRCNGLSIGQTGSSATELAGPKAQALYEYLWSFPNIALDSATKGANANADFLALKRLVLPDLRGRTIAGMDDMGATAANRLTAATGGFGISGIVLGNAGGGTESRILAQNNLPAVDLASSSLSWTQGTSTATWAVGTETFTGTAKTPTSSGGTPVVPTTGSGGSSVVSGVGVTVYSTATHNSLDAYTPEGTISVTGTVGSIVVPGTVGGTVPLTVPGAGNSGVAFTIVQPTMVLTFYIKL